MFYFLYSLDAFFSERACLFFPVQRCLFEIKQKLEKRSGEGKWWDTIINLEEGEDIEKSSITPSPL